MIKSVGETLRGDRFCHLVTSWRVNTTLQIGASILRSRQPQPPLIRWWWGVFWCLVHFSKGRFGYSSRPFPQRTFPLRENTLQLTAPSGSPDLLLRFLLWDGVGGGRWLHYGRLFCLAAPLKQLWLLAAIPELQASALVCFPTGPGVKAAMTSQQVHPSANHSLSLREASLGWTSCQETLEPLLLLYVSF